MANTLKRTDTSASSSIVYQSSTTLTFTQTTASPDHTPFDVRFHFTPDAKFDTMPHFHIDKTEFLFIEKGTARLTLNGVVTTVDRSSGVIEIPRWAPHRWEVLGGEETIVLERTDPSDGRKEAFFRNFVGLINDYGAMPPPLQVFKILAEWDNYPIGQAPWMAKARTPIIGITRLIGFIAGLAGYKAIYREYTPNELLEKIKQNS